MSKVSEDKKGEIRENIKKRKMKKSDGKSKKQKKKEKRKRRELSGKKKRKKKKGLRMKFSLSGLLPKKRKKINKIRKGSQLRKRNQLGPKARRDCDKLAGCRNYIVEIYKSSDPKKKGVKIHLLLSSEDEYESESESESEGEYEEESGGESEGEYESYSEYTTGDTGESSYESVTDKSRSSTTSEIERDDGDEKKVESEEDEGEEEEDLGEQPEEDEGEEEDVVSDSGEESEESDRESRAPPLAEHFRKKEELDDEEKKDTFLQKVALRYIQFRDSIAQAFYIKSWKDKKEFREEIKELEGLAREKKSNEGEGPANVIDHLIPFYSHDNPEVQYFDPHKFPEEKVGEKEYGKRKLQLQSALKENEKRKDRKGVLNIKKELKKLEKEEEKRRKLKFKARREEQENRRTRTRRRNKPIIYTYSRRIEESQKDEEEEEENEARTKETEQKQQIDDKRRKLEILHLAMAYKKRSRKVRNVDLVFLCDLSGTRSLSYVRQCVDIFTSEESILSIRYGLVGVKFDVVSEFHTIPLVPEVDLFKNCIDQLNTSGGSDRQTSNILDGLSRVCGMNWDQNNSYPTRILFHVTDKPCFGYDYHNILVEDDEEIQLNYDSQGLRTEWRKMLKTSMLRLRDLRVQYFFFLIPSSIGKVVTRKMAGKFKKAYDNKDPKKKVKKIGDLELNVCARNEKMDFRSIFSNCVKIGMKKERDYSLAKAKEVTTKVVGGLKKVKKKK